MMEPLPVAKPWPGHQRLDLARTQARQRAVADVVATLAGLLDFPVDHPGLQVAAEALQGRPIVLEQDCWLHVSGAAKLQQCQERLAQAREDWQRAEHEIALWKRPPEGGR
jgi:hypothetical protein